MKRYVIRLTALLLAAMLMLSGCSQVLLEIAREELDGYLDTVTGPAAESPAETRSTTPAEEAELTFSQMEYTRPDMEKLQKALDDACALAEGTDLDAIMDAIWLFYDEYDWFYTNYSLSDIHYCQDVTDAYWEEEYSFCADNSAAVDAALEELYYTLAKSPCRKELEGEDYFGEGFFDDYDGENNWDDRFTALLREESELVSRYYDLSAETSGLSKGSDAWYAQYADPLAQVLVDLVGVRQEMAAHWDYDSYAEFAWDFYYYRDYSPADMDAYMEAICRELVPIYEDLADSDVWDYGYFRSREPQIYEYVRISAEAMGGSVWEAFQLMERRELYDISYSVNKYGISFETYLTSYEVPFLFLCPYLENGDKLTFAHEFGHFCNDHQSHGSSAGVDVLEVFSQGMEYLTLCYGENTQQLSRTKLADSISTYVEQSAFATFEHRLYELKDPTVEDLYALYDEVASDFGFGSVGYDPREFVTIPHFFTNPMYIDSYVVSNDAAIQIYQLELATPGAGLERYEEHLDTQELWFLSFLDSAGLESPFAPGRLEAVRDLFRAELLG